MNKRLVVLLSLFFVSWAIASGQMRSTPPAASQQSAAATSAAPARAEVLVLGTYHMGNPGHDIYNVKADDVMSQKRQQEIAQLIEVLKRFRPTKIAIEATVGSKKVEQQYSDYLAGKYSLSRNEIDQIGYRLAKELGHAKVYPVDEDGDFPWLRVVNYAKANGQTDKLNALNASAEKAAKEQNDFLLSHTVLETLERINSDRAVAESLAWYYAVVRFGEPYEYAGPDLLASWYQRNIRIYHNIVSLIESPNDRVLVIYGYGHLGWLRQDVSSDPNLRLRQLAEFDK
ncbi:MAG: DUF5694 domain-containing protein [Pyrinomonadaceae bacterium]